METDIYLQGTPTPPCNRPEVRAAIWKQLRPQWLSHDAAMMVLMAKLPSKQLPLASVYCPTAKVHAANDALVVRGYKHMTGTTRHAHTRRMGTLGARLPGPHLGCPPAQLQVVHIP